jgi:hypothetical protein
VTTSRWTAWHDGYNDPASNVSRRLVHVRRRLRDALHAAPAGPVRLISLCAGDGRDVLGVLPGHPRRPDVSTRLVELDPDLAARARATAAGEGLDRVEVVTGDAADVTRYADLAPVQVVLLCGIFGNIDDAAVRTTVGGVRQLCRPGTTVIWTRHRQAPDLTPRIRDWFAEAGFAEVAFDTEEGCAFGVGTHRFAAIPPPLEPGAPLFAFLPHKR